MRELFILIAHLLVTLAKLGTRGGLAAVAAESLAVKHQLLIMKRARRRAPNLTSWDRLVLGVCALLVPVPIQNLNSDVLMMEPAEDWYRSDAAGLLRSPKIWSVFVQ
jgi:hypothetical protein